MDACEQCGQPHVTRFGEPSCRAHKKRSLTPCQNPRVTDQFVCRMHGAGSPRAKAAAVIRGEERYVRSTLVKLGRPDPIKHPIYELLDLAAELKQWQVAMRERVQDLEELYTTDKLGVEKERALVTLYTRAQADLAKLLVDMSKLDLQTRALRLQQEAASDVVKLVSRALEKAGLSEFEPQVRAELAAGIRDMQTEKPQKVTALV